MGDPGATVAHKLCLAPVDMHTVRRNRLWTENAKAVQTVNRPQPVLINGCNTRLTRARQRGCENHRPMPTCRLRAFHRKE